MSNTITITPTEAAAGVTVEAVTKTRAKTLVINKRAVLPRGTGPALSECVARLALGVDSVRFQGLTGSGYPIYRRY